MTAVSADPDRWLRHYHQTTGCAVRLVCFPHAGGSACYYRPVSTRFAAHTEVVALQYPGRQERRHEPCVRDLMVLADLVSEQLLALPAKPTVFFGHSMGAVLGFEVAVRMESVNRGPASLVASGRRAPSTHRDDRVHERDDAGILDEVRMLNGTDSTVLADEEVLRMSLPAIRGDYTAVETYRCPPGRAVRAPITVLTGDTDPKTTLDEARAWERHTEGAFRMKVFPGGHFFIAECSAAVNAELAAELTLVRRSAAATLR